MEDPLFKPGPQRQGPGTEGETTFDFLERGGNPEAIGIRRWIEAWFQKYPEEHREELGKRLKSRDFRAFMGAYFELQVFSALSLRDCDMEVHPGFAGKRGLVDFRVTHGEDSFYVEATVCGLFQGNVSNANEEDAVRKIREAFSSPHSDVVLETDGELVRALPRKRLVGPIKELLDSCPADEICRLEREHPWRLPRTSIQEGDWRLDVCVERPPSPKSIGRVVGPIRGGPADGTSPVAKALARKAEDWKRKHTSDPFVIAVNTCHADYSWGDEQDAIHAASSLASGQDAFAKPLRSVSGIIVLGNATLGNERRAPVRLYENPDIGAPDCLRFLRQETNLGSLIEFG